MIHELNHVLLYNNALAPQAPYHRFCATDRAQSEHLCAWALSELSEDNNAVVTRYPDPLIAPYLLNVASNH